MPAETPYFEAAAQLIPFLLVGVLFVSHVWKHDALSPSVALGATALVAGEAAALYALAVEPGVFTTWATTVGIAVGVSTLGSDPTWRWEELRVRGFRPGEAARRAEISQMTWRESVRLTVSVALLLGTFYALPAGVSVWVTVAAVAEVAG